MNVWGYYYYNVIYYIEIFTLLHALHFPFSERRCTQWWCVAVCSRYCRTPTSRNVGLHAIFVRSKMIGIQLPCATILHAEHFIRGPCFCFMVVIVVERKENERKKNQSKSWIMHIYMYVCGGWNHMNFDSVFARTRIRFLYSCCYLATRVMLSQ